MRILILSSRFPYPLEKGDKLRLYHQLKGLAETHEIHLFSLSELEISKEDYNEVDRHCKSITVCKISSFGSKLHTLKGMVSSYPFQVEYFYRRKVKNRLDQAIQKIEPDVIYCQLIRMARYLEGVALPKVIDFMDAFSLNAQRRSDHESGLGKLFFRKEANKVKAYEIKASRAFDTSTIISEKDKKAIDTDKKVHVVSNGLDTDFFSKNQDVQKDVDVLFVGNMGYHPNVLAAQYLVQKVLPLLPPKTKIMIAGSRPTAQVKALASDNVTITGWIDDIRTAYSRGKVFVAPIFSGAGQQNKILEAMSMELPCITTDIVNEGIGGEHRSTIFVANNAQEMADEIMQLLANEDARKDVGESARKFVVDKYSWITENKKLEDIITHTYKDKK